MADEQDKTSKPRRRWFQFKLSPIKRAMYEWGAIFAAAFFGLLLTYWVSSLFSSNGVFVLLAYPRVHFLASGGNFELASDANCREFFASIDGNSAWLKSFLTSDEQYALPGFQYRSVTYREEGGNRWIARISVLIPCAILLAITCTCVWRYRVVARETRQDSTTD